MNPTASNNNEDQAGLLSAYRLDGNGGGTPLSWAEITQGTQFSSPVWIHLDHSQTSARVWLTSQNAITSVIREALLAENPRPRSFEHAQAIVLILRGINPSPDSDDDDLVSIRMWLEKDRVITLRQRTTTLATSLTRALDEGVGPKNTNDFLIKIIRTLLDRVEEVVDTIDERVYDLEEQALDKHHTELRAQLAQLRRTTIDLRRHLAPQRQAVDRLVSSETNWLTDQTRVHLREFSDRLQRHLETLDSARERALVIQEELNSHLAERTNHTMYLISVFTAVFLPLGLITGLLGINVGGMPGTENPSAFWWVCGLLSLTTLSVVLALRLKRWL
jgi:zinc transporter